VSSTDSGTGEIGVREVRADVPSITHSSFFNKLASPDLTMCIVVIIWGGNFAVLKTAYAQIAPFPFTALRFGLATVLMLLLLWWREGDCRFPAGSFGKFFWLGVVGNTIYQSLFANGLARKNGGFAVAGQTAQW